MGGILIRPKICSSNSVTVQEEKEPQSSRREDGPVEEGEFDWLDQLFPEFKRRQHVVDVSETLLLEGYAVGKTIGEGTYGKVKTAINLKSNTRVAVKIIDLSGIDREQLDYFVEREYRALAMLKHPNIINFKEGIRIGPCVCLIMELAEGGDLLEHLLREGPMSNWEAKRVFKNLADALRYCHDHGVAHRDLKCENILLSRSGTAKLGDFGLVHISQTDPTNSLQTRTYCGSLAYVAPEILASHLENTSYNPMNADIWSLGSILYTMVVGAMPFNSIADETLLLREKNQRRPSFHIVQPSNMNKRIDPNCKRLIDIMLQPHVERRANLDDVFNSDWLKE